MQGKKISRRNRNGNYSQIFHPSHSPNQTLSPIHTSNSPFKKSPQSPILTSLKRNNHYKHLPTHLNLASPIAHKTSKTPYLMVTSNLKPRNLGDKLSQKGDFREEFRQLEKSFRKYRAEKEAEIFNLNKNVEVLISKMRKGGEAMGKLKMENQKLLRELDGARMKQVFLKSSGVNFQNQLKLKNSQYKALQQELEEQRVLLAECEGREEFLSSLNSSMRNRLEAKKTEKLKKFEKSLLKKKVPHDKILAYLLKKLDSLYTCPLSYEPFKTPNILLSGHSIHPKFQKELTSRHLPDPYCREFSVVEVVNRLAGEVKEVIEEAKEMLDKGIEEIGKRDKGS